MPEAYFRPLSLDKILQRSVPPGMHYVFEVNHRRMISEVYVERFEEVVRWCEENFNEQYPCEPARWAADRRYFYRLFVRSQTDAAAFKLRWC